MMVTRFTPRQRTIALLSNHHPTEPILHIPPLAGHYYLRSEFHPRAVRVT